jgi:integrase
MLTNIAIQNLRAAAKPFKMADSGGLYILTAPSGTKSWRFDFRYFVSRKTLALGQYPNVSLAEARKKRDDAKGLLSLGKDPCLQRKIERVAARTANANTFGLVAGQFLGRMVEQGRSPATVEKNRWMLEIVAGRLADRPIAEITAAEILDLLQGVERRGKRDTAVFRFAVATLRAESDPTFALRGALSAPIVNSRAALTTPEQVGGLLRAIRGYDGWPSLKGALEIQALCFARPGETRTMAWSELDLGKATWSIPAAKAKMRRPHSVPLSRQAVAVLEQMTQFKHGDQVFPSMMSGKLHLSENSMNSALRRMGFTKEQHTAHGFRATASTILNESKLFSSDAIEAQLAHVEGNKVRRAYNRAEYWDDRVAMMQWWADYLDGARLLGS